METSICPVSFVPGNNLRFLFLTSKKSPLLGLHPRTSCQTVSSKKREYDIKEKEMKKVRGLILYDSVAETVRGES
jgi:hypothetical protein